MQFCKRCIDTGTFLIASLFLDEVKQRVLRFDHHRLYLNAVVGAGSGASIALLFALTIAQIGSCAVLTLPVLYGRLGAAIPSFCLGASLFCELILYNGFADVKLMRTALGICIALVLIGVLRGDARHRLNALDQPVHGFSVTIEATVRKVCTKFRMSLMLIPLSLYLFWTACWHYAFWRYGGTKSEMMRVGFRACVSEFAIFLLLSSEDRSPAIELVTITKRLSYEKYKQLYYRVHGYPYLGKKKNVD